MTDIAVRKENGNRIAPPARSWEPRRDQIRMMRDLINWDPFGEMTPFVAHAPAGFVPSFGIKETKDA